jgi:hypothetical protein
MPPTGVCQRIALATLAAPSLSCSLERRKSMERTERVQLHLALSFKKEPRDHPRIAALLEEGYRIDQLQRVTDKEAVVTLVRRPSPAPSRI